ncbi:MAG: TonB-dependent receptor plug domain-containing protein, partial [Candidatus Kapaibacteriota bacterium]
MMKYVKIYTFFYIFQFSFLIAFSNTKDTVDFSYKELVISALRYPERIFEVPLSISYVSGKNFIAYRGLSIDEPLISVPGVLVQQRSGSQDIKITVRGFGSRGAGDRSNSGTVRGLKFLLDGIPQTEPDGRTSLDLLDISFVENIEIIRSNASALWGNASGAIFSFTTVPMDDTPSLSFSKSIGSWGLDKNVLKFKTSLGPNGIAYLNSLFSKFAGWRENSNSEKFLINFGIKVPLAFVKSKSNEETYSTIIQVNGNLAKNLFHIPGALTQQIFDTMPHSANPIYLQNKERRNNRLAQIGFSLTNNFDKTTSLYLQGFLTSK